MGFTKKLKEKSYWNSISSFVKKVLHKDDNYSSCKGYIETDENCRRCQKAPICKKGGSPASAIFQDSVQDLIDDVKSGSGYGSGSSTSDSPFNIEIDQTKCIISFGEKCFIQLSIDGSVIIKGEKITADGNFGTTSGGSGVLCLTTVATYTNGIVRGDYMN